MTEDTKGRSREGSSAGRRRLTRCPPYRPPRRAALETLFRYLSEPAWAPLELEFSRADHGVRYEGDLRDPTGAARSRRDRCGAAPLGPTRSVDHGRFVPRRI